MSHLWAVAEARDRGEMAAVQRWGAQEGSADQEAPYASPTSIFESSDHLLHGALHLNGFGHLLRMNGGNGRDQPAGEGVCLKGPSTCFQGSMTNQAWLIGRKIGRTGGHGQNQVLAAEFRAFST